MKRFKWFAIAVMLFSGGLAQAQEFKVNAPLLETIDVNYGKAADQYKLMMKSLEANRFPKTFNTKTGKLETSDSGWWCSGFYPATLLELYQRTNDPLLLTEAERMLALLEKEQYNTSTHDLGFMMFNSFGTALKINPKPAYKEILINSAKSLSSRFDPKIGCIKSWNGKDNDFLVIIDNMMNLELLFWATRETGDSSYHRIAVIHANTTMQNHFRPDYSSFHVVNYNPETGAVQKKHTAQGFADDSAWARGQAWGLYGYVVMYRETKKQIYLDQANAIAKFILGHRNMPSDKIAYWDFNAPNIPRALRDASASAIIASGLLELCQYVDPKKASSYFSNAERMLKSLSAAPYLSPVGTNGGFILQHNVGHLPQKTEVDQPLTYADYYYVEAMERYEALSVAQTKKVANPG